MWSSIRRQVEYKSGYNRTFQISVKISDPRIRSIISSIRGKRVAILNRNVVQFSIVNDRPAGTVFLPYEEHRAAIGHFTSAGSAQPALSISSKTL
jgi:hypothetical protein